jgi:hypothetical protein
MKFTMEAPTGAIVFSAEPRPEPTNKGKPRWLCDAAWIEASALLERIPAAGLDEFTRWLTAKRIELSDEIKRLAFDIACTAHQRDSDTYRAGEVVGLTWRLSAVGEALAEIEAHDILEGERADAAS